MRGLLAEFGIVIPKGIHCISKRMPLILEEAENGLLGMMRNLLAKLNEHFKVLDQQVDELEAQIKHWHKESELSRKLEAIPGIGPITASAIVATVGNATEFRNGRQLAAWLGLVPKQHSSGGKQNLLGISKRGGFIPTHLNDPRCEISLAVCWSQSGTLWLVTQVNGATQQQCRSSGPSEQECSCYLGVARQRD